MQNTTTNVTTGSSSSPKQEKTEEVLPRFSAVSSTPLPVQENRPLNLLQRIAKFLRVFFNHKKPVAPVVQATVTPVAPPAILLQENVEKPAIQPVKVIKPLPAAMMLSAQGVTRSKYGTSMRKMAEQQFDEMDITRATRN